MNDLAKIIRAGLKHRGMTQKALAKKAGISEGAVTTLLRNGNCRFDTFMMLLEAMDLDIKIVEKKK